MKSIDDLDEDDYRRRAERFQGDNFQKNLDLVGQVEEIAKDKGVTPSQLALAWVLAQGEDIVPIPGTKRIKYLEENIGAIDVELSDDDLRRIDEAFPKGATAGNRYPDMSTVNR
jgi:aryl-alcohol dehydrogenase-like predicted oxidoreductase